MPGSYTPYRRHYVQVLRDIVALVEADLAGKPTDRRSLAYKIHALALAATTRKLPQGKVKDMTDQRFGRLVVLRRDHGERRDSNRTARWIARCDCGRLTSVDGASLRRKSGSRGQTKSCGCLRGENLRRIKRLTRPGAYPGGYDTPPLTEARVAEAGWSKPPQVLLKVA